ncbi:hypothetical protein BDAP_002420 [Binucleata daphniae]
MNWIVSDINENTHAYVKKLIDAKKNKQESNKEANVNEKNVSEKEEEYKISLWYYFFLGLLNSFLFYLIFLRYNNIDDFTKDLSVVQKVVNDLYKILLHYYKVSLDYMHETYMSIKKYIS